MDQVGMSTGTKVTGALMVVAVIAVAVAAFNFLTILVFEPTGHASSDVGEANLTILSRIEINFTVDSVDWDDGYVNDTESYAILDTEGTMTGTQWNTVTQGLVLESLSNENITVNLSSSEDALSFIGGAESTFKWKISENEAGACPTATPSTYQNVVTGAIGQQICSSMWFRPNPNTLLIDLEVNISKNAPIGDKGTVITATAAPVIP